MAEPISAKVTEIFALLCPKAFENLSGMGCMRQTFSQTCVAFLGSRWISGSTMDFWIRDGFFDSGLVFGVMMDFRTHDGFLYS